MNLMLWRWRKSRQQSSTDSLTYTLDLNFNSFITAVFENKHLAPSNILRLVFILIRCFDFGFI